MQPQRLLNDGLQEDNRAQALVRQVWQSVKLALQVLEQLGMASKFEKQVCERGGRRIASRNNDELSVAVQVPTITPRLGSFFKVGQDPGKYIGLVRLILSDG